MMAPPMMVPPMMAVPAPVSAQPPTNFMVPGKTTRQTGEIFFPTLIQSFYLLPPFAGNSKQMYMLHFS